MTFYQELKYNKKNFLKTLIFFFFFNIINLLNFIFQILIIRNLSGQNFITYNVLNSFSAFLLLPVASITIGISLYINRHEKIDKSFFLLTIKSFSYIYFFLLLFLILFKNSIENYINVYNTRVYFIIILTTVITYINSIFLIFYHANLKSLKYCILNLIPVIIKLIILLLLFYFNYKNYEVVFISIFVATLISFIIIFWDFFKKKIENKKELFKKKSLQPFKEIFLTFISLTSIYFFLNFDVMLLSKKISDIELSYNLISISIIKINYYLFSMMPLNSIFFQKTSKSIIYEKISNLTIIVIITFLQILLLISMYYLGRFFLKSIFNFENIILFQKMIMVYGPITISLNIISIANIIFLKLKYYVPIISQFSLIILFFIISNFLENDFENLINFFKYSSMFLSFVVIIYIFKCNQIKEEKHNNY
jgi:hypothetical protein